MRRWSKLEVLGFTGVSLAMWPIPLLNRLHVESAAVLATAAFFLGGLAALAIFRDQRRVLSGRQVWQVLRGRLGILVLPLVLMLIPMAWAPNCGWPAGTGFFLLFVPISSLGGVSAAAVLHRLGGRRPRGGLLLLGVLILAMGPLWDLGLHPQFYTYNHVFGGVLGPIYDEQLAVRTGLFVFRVLTVLWALAGLLWASGHAFRAVAILGLVALVYVFSGRLGINTGYEDLQRSLPGVVETPHFRFHYDPSREEPSAIHRMAEMAEFEYQRISVSLETEILQTTWVFLYPDADTRASLTGARYTSVAPVWLAEPQVHVESGSFEALFPHELVHAFSREFGLPGLRASPAVGLVEGLAVALEPASSRPGPDHLVLASVTATGIDPSLALAGALSPWGFWTGRGGVSYTVTGSFVSWLLSTYEVSRFKEAYQSGDLASAYGVATEKLVSRWMASLQARTWVDAESVRRARTRLGAPSLFERTCPHYRPPAIRLLDQARTFRTRGDSLGASRATSRAMALAPQDPAVVTAWVLDRKAAGDLAALGDTLLERDPERLPVTAAVVRSDCIAAGGDAVRAGEAYRAILARLPGYAREEGLAVALRLAAVGDPAVASWLLGHRPAAAAQTTAAAPTPAAAPSTPAPAPTPSAGQALRHLSPGGTPDSLSVHPPPGLPPRFRASWPALRSLAIARGAYRNGEYERAAEYATEAARAFRRMGDLTMEAHVGHLANRFRFSATQTPSSL